LGSEAEGKMRAWDWRQDAARYGRRDARRYNGRVKMGGAAAPHRTRLPTKSEREQTLRRVGFQSASRAHGGDRWTANLKDRGDEAVAGCGDEPSPPDFVGSFALPERLSQTMIYFRRAHC
jgi:hypothetical protein